MASLLTAGSSLLFTREDLLALWEAGFLVSRVHDLGGALPASLLPEQKWVAEQLGVLRASAGGSHDHRGGTSSPGDVRRPPLPAADRARRPRRAPVRQQVSFDAPPREGCEERCIVFGDLWNKGYFVRPGAKFGADYLVYSKDPEAAHGPEAVLYDDDGDDGDDDDAGDVAGDAAIRGSGTAGATGSVGVGDSASSERVHADFVVLIVPWSAGLRLPQTALLARSTETVRKTTVLASVIPPGAEQGGGSARVSYLSMAWVPPFGKRA